MGLCYDFGSHIAEGCEHPMRAGVASCTCERCGVVCEGLFAGCSEVWARGPHPILLGLKRDANELARATPTTTNGHEVADVLTPATLHPARADSPAPAAVARTVDGGVEALRREVDGLRGALAQEQALVANLIATPRADPVADADVLRAMVDTAVRKAVRREAVALSDAVVAIVEGLRRDMETLTQAQEANFAALKEAVGAVAAASAAMPDELNRRDAGNRKALRTALDLELAPIIDVVAESIAQSDYELKAIGTKLDALAETGADIGDAINEISAVVVALASEAGVELADPDDEAPPPTFARAAAPPPAPPPARTPGRRVSLRGSRP